MAGIWRALAACASATADIQHVASLHLLARCTSHLLANVQLKQQPRQFSSSSLATAESTTAAATSSSSDTALATGLQQQAGQEGLLSTLISQEGSKELGMQHIGLFYNFDRSRVPEAFQQFHQSFYSPRPHKLQRKAGCRGLQAEFTSTSSTSLMWRRSSQELAQVLSSSGGQRVHIQGPAGSGKSIAVVQLVEWARNNDWLVLYIPSAADLTRGGFFYKRPHGTYDTIISAQHILKSMSDSHGKQLVALKLRLQESMDLLHSPAAAAAVGGAGRGAKAGDSLSDLVNTGLSTDDNGQLAVDCCLQLVKELAAASSDVPVLLAVDDYNTLYWRTEYGTSVSRTPRGKPAYQYRRELKVNKLNLARAFKLLERHDLGSCHVVVADSSNRRVPADVRVPNPTGSTYHMPRFSAVETAHALYYYHERGLVPSPPSEQQVAAMKSITNGSGKELRMWSLSITQTDMGLL